MPQITDIQPGKKDPKRVNVFLDGEFAFAVSLEAKIVNKLQINQELSDEKIAKLIQQDQLERLTNQALRFLSFRPRSEKEVRNYLIQKLKLSDQGGEEKQNFEKSIRLVIEKLKHLGQINDEDFAKWWVEQRNRFRPKGSRVIKLELLQKGIDRETIEKVTPLRPFDSAQGYAGQVNELDLATTAALKKISSYQKLEQREFKIKMGQFLARKGFDWVTIKKVVDTFLEKRVE